MASYILNAGQTERLARHGAHIIDTHGYNKASLYKLTKRVDRYISGILNRIYGSGTASNTFAKSNGGGLKKTTKAAVVMQRELADKAAAIAKEARLKRGSYSLPSPQSESVYESLRKRGLKAVPDLAADKRDAAEFSTHEPHAIHKTFTRERAIDSQYGISLHSICGCLHCKRRTG